MPQEDFFFRLFIYAVLHSLYCSSIFATIVIATFNILPSAYRPFFLSFTSDSLLYWFHCFSAFSLPLVAFEWLILFCIAIAYQRKKRTLPKKEKDNACL